jgi:AraC family transcriptional regulator of adaptative response/methylated-DNA-[protein]-cysteine methyltransferase
MRDADRWRAVQARDARFDGRFICAVRTTGIFCRPSCPSRRPVRRNVIFFLLPEAARREGFRPCLRCRPEQTAAADPAIERVWAVCRHIEDHFQEPPSLRALAGLAGLSPFHFQRTFKRIVGVTPRQYAEEIRLHRVRGHLKEARNVTDALYQAGYGSSSRLYEKAPSRLGMTPASYRRGGEGARIGYTIAASPLGRLMVAATSRGICRVTLGDANAGLEADLRREFPRAELYRDDARLARWLRAIQRDLEGRAPCPDLPLDIRATAFQRQVWEALLAIPRGETRSYSDVARAIGHPKAARAVGTACGANPVGLVIPCHRVVREDGSLGGFGFGLHRKVKLLAMEKKRSGRARKA